jgi:hypothetical protein
LPPLPYHPRKQTFVIAAARLDLECIATPPRDKLRSIVTPRGARFGGSLALSPATSVTAGFNFGYLTQSADFIVPGSDRILSSVDVGFSTILWKRTLLNVTGQFGLTGHVPDFRLIASIPVRF